MIELAAKRANFRVLHSQGCFVLPNPWDRGSARLLQHLGFLALASTSSGAAWSSGRPDYAVTRDDALSHLTELCAATELPVNADFESGFAGAPEGVANNVTLAIRTGVAGLSIEDRRLDGAGLYDFDLAVDRIRAAHYAVADHNVILVARTEGLLSDASQVGAAIDRLVAFADAGADCLYAPGVQKREDIAAMVKAVAPKPLNVLMYGPGHSVAELADLGVRRISIGGTLARVALGAMLKVAEEIKNGSFDGLASAAPGKVLNGIFSEFGKIR